MKVEYVYGLDEEVKTPFGDDGIVTMLGFDDGGKQYAVKTSNDSQWYKEKELSARS